MKITPCLIYINAFSFLLSAFYPPAVSAIENSPHIHGVAELTLAVVDKTIDVHLIIPAESLLGFEHQAHSNTEKNKVLQMKQLLAVPHNIIRLQSPYCHINKININTGEILLNEPPQHDHQTEHGHKTTNQHHEIDVKYQFNCTKANTVSVVTLSIWQHVTAIKSIRAVWLTDTTQGATRLTDENPSFKLK